MKEREGEIIENPIKTNPYVEGSLVTKSMEEYPSFENPSTPTLVVVQHPSLCDSTFHFLIEGYSGAQYWVFSQPSYDPVASKSSPIAPFWDTSLVQTISEYGATTLSYVKPP